MDQRRVLLSRLRDDSSTEWFPILSFQELFMTSNSIGRCVLLVAAMAFSFPFATTASHVSGGQDVPNCDTIGINPNGACLALPGQTCSGNKAVCVGCVNRATNPKVAICATGNAACGGAGCVTNQVNSQLSGKACIQNGCP